MSNNALFNLTAEILIDYIEHMATSKRGLRADYADLLSANSWRSRDFEAMVDQVCKNIEVIDRRYSRGGRLSESETLEAAIPDYVDGHFAFCCISDRGISDNLDDREYNSMSAVADKWEAEWAPQRERGRDRDPRGRDSRGGNGGSYRNRQEPVRSSPSRDRGGRTGSRDGRYNVPDPRDNRRDDRDDDTRTASINDPWGSLAQATEEVREPVETRREEPVKATVVTKPQGVDYSKPRPYDSYWIGDQHWVIAHHCDWVLTDVYGVKTIPSLYDVNTQLRYLVKHNSGQVTEEFITVTNDSRYLQQELLYGGAEIQDSPRSNRRVTAQGGVVSTSETEDVKTKPTPLSDIMLDLDTSTFASTCSQYNVVADLREAAMGALLKLSSCSEDTMVALSPYLVKDPIVLIGYAANTETTLDALTTPTDLHALRNRMIEMKEDVIPELWDKLNDRISHLIKQSCRFQWQFGFKTFNFVEHFLQMLERMKDVEGEAVVKNFIQRSNSLIDKAIQRFTPEEAIQHLSHSPSSNGFPNAVVFADFEYLFAIRKTADELGLGKQLENQDKGVSVTQLEPNYTLSTTIRNIYRALPIQEYERTTQCIRLVTSDNKIVTIYPHMGRQDQFIISQAVKG